MTLNRYNGSAHEEVTLKRWTGSTWEPITLRRWNGSAWEVVASPETVIDDFNDQSWDGYSGTYPQWGFSTSVTREGQASIFANLGAGTYRQIQAYEGGGLNYYPQRGDVIRYWTRLGSSGSVSQFLFGKPSGSSNTNHYEIYVDDDLNRFGVLKDTSSGLSVVAPMQNISPSVGSWYEGELDWRTDGTIRVTLFNENGQQLATTQGTDNQFTARGIGFVAGNHVYFDYVRKVN